MQWIAERFFTTGGAWIDAASGLDVSLHVTRSDERNEIGWSEECARLSNLRHPLLNTLLDYGVGPNRCRFEAYERRPALHVAAEADRERIVRHAAQFLQSFEIGLAAERAAVAFRARAVGRAAHGRCLGLSLQGRRALDAVEEALDACAPAGPAIVNVSAPPDAGLRTFRVLVARSARLRGFVPVSPAAVNACPVLIGRLRDRHVCLLDDLGERGRSATAVSQLISALAHGGTRRHVVLRFGRERGPHGIMLDPLGVSSLVRMVFAGGDLDPGAEELLSAARCADGLPGVFVARLCGSYRQTSTSMVVHETAPAYVVDRRVAREPPAIAGRVLGAALRAPHRAAMLARGGRHAAAGRLLERAIRVLQGRTRPLDAARCAVQLGWLALDRGRTLEARSSFDVGHRLAGEDPFAIEASIGSGVALTDDGRFIEAEAVLRGAVAAAATIADTPARRAATAALARCVMWQGRLEEALALALNAHDGAGEPGSTSRLLGVLARAQSRLWRAAAAVRTAREAQHVAAGAGPHAQASAELALAEALAAAGDTEGARAAYARAARLARTHHLPLVRVRARLGMLQGASGSFSVLQGASRCAGVLQGPPLDAHRGGPRLRRLKLPALLAQRLEKALSAATPPLEPVTELETLLLIAQRAPDDGAAALEICRTVGARVGASTVAIFSGDDRSLAVHGRGWPSVPVAARHVIAEGTPIRPDGPVEPREAAEAVRYGGDAIAAIVCRWVAGAVIDVTGAGVLLRAAALSAAPHVRAMLDRPAALPASAWSDLLGESPPAIALRDAVARAARAPFAVLVEGESGSGKELVARAVHRLSPRRDRRFCALNCAALSDDLVETELFGHARGAFTGAAAERAGLFEEADGGTLFLDEVGELSARAQAKLLRVLQDGEVRRVGENFPRRVDVRVVAATNRRLEEEVIAGRFRADLRFRLDVVRIVVPPLRERASDIPLLAMHFWQDASSRVGSRATLSPEALAALARYDWPGNVRELQNVIAWIAVQSPRRGRIGPASLPRHVAQATVPTPCTFEAAREEFERRFVRAALAGANGHRARAAEAMGVTRQGLAKMIRRLGVE